MQLNISNQGRINYGAKRTTAQGPLPRGGPPWNQDLEKITVVIGIYVPYGIRYSTSCIFL